MKEIMLKFMLLVLFTLMFIMIYNYVYNYSKLDIILTVILIFIALLGLEIKKNQLRFQSQQILLQLEPLFNKYFSKDFVYLFDAEQNKKDNEEREWKSKKNNFLLLTLADQYCKYYTYKIISKAEILGKEYLFAKLLYYFLKRVYDGNGNWKDNLEKLKQEPDYDDFASIHTIGIYRYLYRYQHLWTVWKIIAKEFDKKKISLENFDYSYKPFNLPPQDIKLHNEIYHNEYIVMKLEQNHNNYDNEN